MGEIAFFSGGVRTATVTAMRASQVLELTRAAYSALSRDLPELNEAVIRALASRVVSGNSSRADLEPRPGATICVDAMASIAKSSSDELTNPMLLTPEDEGASKYMRKRSPPARAPSLTTDGLSTSIASKIVSIESDVGIKNRNPLHSS